jgi:ketosteroid isomerase-like protein
MAHANEEMLARFYAAYAGRDAEAIAGQLTDDAFVLIPGRGPLGGVYRGRTEAVGFFSTVWEQAPDGFALDLHEVLANDEHGLVIVKVTAQRGDARYDEWETHVHELSDGSSAGVFVYWNDIEPAEAYFSSASHSGPPGSASDLEAG